MELFQESVFFGVLVIIVLRIISLDVTVTYNKRGVELL